MPGGLQVVPRLPPGQSSDVPGLGLFRSLVVFVEFPVSPVEDLFVMGFLAHVRSSVVVFVVAGLSTVPSPCWRRRA
jgi:hypothetical protein